MYELVFSDAASADLVNIIEYIAKDSINNAYKFHDLLINKLSILEKEPLLGAMSKIKRLQQMGYRFLPIQSYIAHYQVDKDKKQVHIIRILHGAMKQDKHLK